MTHTLHRRGSTPSLEGDYVVLAMSAKGFNESGAAAKLTKMREIMSKYNPVNVGDMKSGNIFMQHKGVVFEETRDISIVHAVYTNPQDVERALTELRTANLGISVVVSGLFHKTMKAATQAGCKCHTIQYSLGIFGRTELLPSEDVLEITTMCGHHQVSPRLVEKLADDIKAGRLTPKAAAEQLAYPCVCGVFNPARAAALLAEKAQKNDPLPSGAI